MTNHPAGSKAGPVLDVEDPVVKDAIQKVVAVTNAKNGIVQETNTVEIVFDFTRISFDALLDMLEYSAVSGINDPNEPPDPRQFLTFVRSMRAVLVKSSRPLTGADFREFATKFWRGFNEVYQEKN